MLTNVFLHGYLNKKVYRIPHPSLNNIKINQVSKITKSLYGLKQASRQWFAKLSSSLISNDFIQSKPDHSLFTKKSNTTFNALIVYVDDIVLVKNFFLMMFLELKILII